MNTKKKRGDLSLHEEYAKFKKAYGYTNKRFADVIGASVTQIANIFSKKPPCSLEASAAAIRATLYIRQVVERTGDAGCMKREYPKMYYFTNSVCANRWPDKKTWDPANETCEMYTLFEPRAQCFDKEVDTPLVRGALKSIREHYGDSVWHAALLVGCAEVTLRSIEWLSSTLDILGAYTMRYALVYTLRFIRDFFDSDETEVQYFAKSDSFDEDEFYALLDYLAYIMSK